MFEAARSRQGQVIDAAMSDGAASLMMPTSGMYAAGCWRLARQDNLLDGAAPFCSTYRCQDGKWLAVGAIEQPFYAQLLTGMGLDPAQFQPQHDRSAHARLIDG